MYNAYITKIKNLRKHSNADRLMVGQCFGNQVIVGLNQEENGLGIYFPTDGQIGKEYAEKNNLLRKRDENGKEIGGYLDPNKRNIRSIRLRKEMSDGLFMPIESLSSFTDISTLKEGDCINVLNGIEICKKYIPEIKNKERSNNKNTPKPKQIKDKFPIFHEHIDTKQLAYNKNRLKEGDVCYLTLKMHGTSARTSYSIKEKLFKNNIFKRLFTGAKYTINKTWEYISGSRRVVLKNFDGGYYENNNFRKHWHDFFKNKLYKGETVYYEIVGFQDINKPIMGTVSNKLTNDKEFIKKYGDTTTYHYSCENGKNDIYIYRMSITNEDGVEIDYAWDMVKNRAEQIGAKTVPELDRFVYISEEDLNRRLDLHTDGEDPIGITHIREGVVLRVEGKEKFTAFKNKGFNFKVLEGIIKDSGVVDLEEQEDLITE